MNLLVVLRPVRDPSSFTVNRKAQKIFIHRDAFIVNPSDRNALEAALQLAGSDDRVTAVACGGEASREVLRQARALGAARAVWVPVADEPAPDALRLTQVLQTIVSDAGPIDLVLLGAEMLDHDTAQVGPRLAAALDWPFVDGICEVRRLPAGGLGCVVLAPGDKYHLLGLTSPTIAAVARDSNRPRFAPAAQIVTIYQDPNAVESLSLAALGLDPAGLAPVTTVRGETFPPERTLGRLLTGASAVTHLAEALKGR